jgi:undecaprenyl-diphosphatase
MYLNSRTIVCAVFAVLVLAAPKATRGIGTKEPTPNRMTLTQAIVLGAVEGMTEYLPVSSTGHLLVAETLMGLSKAGPAAPEGDGHAKAAADAYAICIQAGAIIAVLGLYFTRMKQLVRGVLGKDSTGLKMAANIAAGFLPAAILGVLLNKTIKAHLFGMWPVVLAWFVGGLAILATLWLRKGNTAPSAVGKPLEQLSVGMALLIGVMQCIAMWPGVSRSLVTIVGGLVVGLSVPAAVEFSFLLGLVTLSAATCYDALKHGQIMLQTFDVAALAVGLCSAFVFAVLSIKWMVGYLNRHDLAIFGYYRVAVAALVTTLLLTGIL